MCQLGRRQCRDTGDRKKQGSIKPPKEHNIPPITVLDHKQKGLHEMTDPELKITTVRKLIEMQDNIERHFKEMSNSMSDMYTSITEERDLRRTK